MKKLGFILMIGCLMGCSTSWKEKGQIRCTAENENQGMRSKVELLLHYEDNTITKHTSSTALTATDATTYDQLRAVVESAQIVYESMEGAKYQIEQDDEAMQLQETIELDFTILSEENRKKVVSYGEQEVFDAKEIMETLQQQGYTCDIE